MVATWTTIALLAGAPQPRGYYTEARLAVMRRNVEKHEWARKIRDGILAGAERWAARPDADLRALVIPPQVPRAYDIHNLGCPVHGVEANRKGLYKWEFSTDRPFKIRCPAGGEEYPSNDFAAFLAGGMKDRSLLTGEYADDGWGWHRPGEAQGYWFVAYYAHWSMRNALLPAIRELSLAAVVAEDPAQARRFAHKCGVLLWQLAAYYPDYAYEKQSREGKEHDSGYTGKFTNMIWEVDTPASCARAYDAVRPYLQEDADLQRLSGLDGAGLDAFLRTRLLREAAVCIMDGSGRIRGNYGMHQQALVAIAAALNEKEQHPTSREMVDWVLANPKPVVDADMGITDALENLVYRDGMPQESPGYNYGWVSTLAGVAQSLLAVDVNLFRHPRFRSLLAWPFDILVAGQFLPPLGDTGDMFAGGEPLRPALCAMALPHVRDPRMAAVLRAQPFAARDLFAPPVEDLLSEFPAEGAGTPAGTTPAAGRAGTAAPVGAVPGAGTPAGTAPGASAAQPPAASVPAAGGSGASGTAAAAPDASDAGTPGPAVAAPGGGGSGAQPPAAPMPVAGGSGAQPPAAPAPASDAAGRRGVALAHSGGQPGSPASAAEAPAAGGSRHFPAYGLATLQSGSEAKAAALCLSYGSWAHHMHRDQLNLLLFAYGNPLLCDVGYPEQTDAFNHKRFGFWSNTASHNTVVVDAHGQGRGPGRLYAYEPNGFAQVVDASCEGAYAGTVDLYRRAAMLVSVGPEHSYVFDVFYVHGGSQHDLVSMGPQADFRCDPPLGPVQGKGTLAGPDVPTMQFYDDPALKDKPLGSVACGGYRGSGFQYFTNVQRAPLAGRAVCDWRLTQPLPGQRPRPWEGIGLRAHLVGGNQEIIACDGRPQGYRHMPETVKFLIRRRQGAGLSSAFTTIWEPYSGRTWIERAELLPIEPADGRAVAVRIRLADGSRHILFHSLEPGRAYVVDGSVRVDGQAACLVLGADGRAARAMLLNGTRLLLGRFSLAGKGRRRSKVASVDYERGIVHLADPVLDRRLRAGQTVLVAPGTFADSLTVREMLSPTELAVADAELRVGGGPVNQVLPEANRIVTSIASPHARVGMTVLNARGEPQGRLASGDRWTLDRTGYPPLRPEHFPAAPGAAGPRFSIAMVGPGDEVVVPDLCVEVLK